MTITKLIPVLAAFAAGFLATAPAYANESCRPGDIFRGVDAAGKTVCFPAPQNLGTIRPLPQWVSYYPESIRLQESTLRDMDTRGVRPVARGQSCAPY